MAPAISPLLLLAVPDELTRDAGCCCVGQRACAVDGTGAPDVHSPLRICNGRL
uniref:Uncharacterized protein n=1 Tax=Arundo donax TaxID=35708 RepID=A0A0A9CAX6_ARUDO